MIKKVEICGVQTSSLTVLTQEEMNDLLVRVRQGDAEARNLLIQGNLKLVLSVVQRFNARKSSPDDLFQVGCIGLIKSIDNFDPAQAVRFSTYAVPMIIGEIRRYLRDNSAVRVSRSLRDIAYKVLTAKEKLTAEKNTDPTVEEIAEELNIPREDIIMALEAVVDPVSLSEPIYNDDGDALYMMDQISSKTDCDSNWIEEICIKDAVRNLSDREKRILSLRFFDGKTQVEVSEEIGISQAQVSRLEKGALDKIKSRI